MKITAAVARTPHDPLQIRTLEMDAPRDDEVQVKIIAAGICRTDLDVRDGYLPTPLPVVLGHEGAGIVESVGSAVTSFVPGDHVVLSMGYCGICEFCEMSLPAYCVEHVPRNFGGARIDGSVCLHDGHDAVHSHFFSQSSFSTHAIAHHSSLVKVAKDVDLTLLGPLACGVMTGAGGVINTLRPKPGSSIAVFGVGTVGLSALMASKIAGCTQRIVVDNKPERLELARELGATDTVLAAPGVDVVKEIQALTAGRGVQNALESSGVKPVISTALASLAELGTLVVTGVLPQGETVEFDAWALLRGRRVLGSVMGDTLPQTFIPRLIEYYQQGMLPLEKLSRRYDLSQINQAIADGISGEVVKAVVVMPHAT